MAQIKSWIIVILCLLPLVVISCFFPVTIAVVALILLSNCWITRSSEVYKMSVALADTNPEVVKLLGRPLKKGIMAAGNRLLTNKGTSASLTIPLSGPRSKGSLIVVAHKEKQKWHFSTLQLRCRGTGDSIDLLDRG